MSTPIPGAVALSVPPASLLRMSLVVMLTNVQTGVTIGRADPSEGGWRTTEVLDPHDFLGLECLTPEATWYEWKGREVEFLVACTEAGPSGIRWKSWCLARELAEDLLQAPEGSAPSVTSRGSAHSDPGDQS